MRNIAYAEKRAASDANCPKCGSCYEVFLLIPPASQGGNCRRAVRHYDCENCDFRFRKLDVGFMTRNLIGTGLSLGKQICKKVHGVAMVPFQLIQIAFSTRYSFRAQRNALLSGDATSAP